MIACTKFGDQIIGSLERIPGRAGIELNSFHKDGDTLDFDYDGDTEVFWDDQRTIVREKQRVFLTEDGTEVLEKDIVLVEEEELEAYLLQNETIEQGHWPEIGLWIDARTKETM